MELQLDFIKERCTASHSIYTDFVSKRFGGYKIPSKLEFMILFFKHLEIIQEDMNLGYGNQPRDIIEDDVWATMKHEVGKEESTICNN